MESQVPSSTLAAAHSTGSFRAGFKTLDQEVKIDALPIRGQLPEWLSGTLVRNGPARFEVGQLKLRHWFDGLAMLHSFSFEGGSVSYANRFLRSPTFEDVEKTGRYRYGDFATDPCRSIFKRVSSMFSPEFGNNPNVNISRIAGRFVAMTETPLPVEFDPSTLATVGVFDYGPNKVAIHHTTAHPHQDPRSQQLFNYFASFGRSSSYNVYRIEAGERERVVFGSAAVREPSYIHSFSITENYVVVAEYPYVVNPLRILLSGKPFIENFVWKPERGARFLVFRRDGGGLVATCPAGPFFAFHHVNAFEKGDRIEVDIAAYEDASVVRSFYLDALRGEIDHPIPPTELRRYHLCLAGGQASYDTISQESIELPRIDYRRNGRDYRCVYATGMSSDDFMNRLVKIDVESGSTSVWSEPGCYPGEPVFVARPGSEGEDDGVLLSVVLDGGSGRSFLLVLGADDLSEIARAEVPHHIPFGFHGQYLR